MFCLAYINGVSTCKIEQAAKSLGIVGLSSSLVSNMVKELDVTVSEFRNRELGGKEYLFLYIDALYEKIRINNRVVCGITSDGNREIIAIEPISSESKENYIDLFRKL